MTMMAERAPIAIDVTAHDEVDLGGLYSQARPIIESVWKRNTLHALHPGTEDPITHDGRALEYLCPHLAHTDAVTGELTQGEYAWMWSGWDSANDIKARALTGDPDGAKDLVRLALSQQWNDGFIGHVALFNNHYRPGWVARESRPDHHESTAITQPPLQATAIEAIVDAEIASGANIDYEFLRQSVDRVNSYHQWLLENRIPSNHTPGPESVLLSIVSANESGYDESPRFAPVLGLTDEEILGDGTDQNPGMDDAQINAHYSSVDWINHHVGHDNYKVFEIGHFNVRELTFNSAFIESNYAMARLMRILASEPGLDEESAVGYASSANVYEMLADRGLDELISECWDDDEGLFYDQYIDRSGEPQLARVNTIASMMPLMVRTLGSRRPDIVDRLVNHHIKNTDEYWTSGSPLPVVALNSPYYRDTTYGENIGEEILWWCGTMPLTTALVVEGLIKQGCTREAVTITSTHLQALVRDGDGNEFRDPHTGDGMRRNGFTGDVSAAAAMYGMCQKALMAM